MMTAPPEIIRDEAALDAALRPAFPDLRDFISQVNSPLVMLGAGGKMGPTLAVLAKHAADLDGHPLEVIAISRYSNDATRQWLENNGVQTHTADLAEASSWTELPDSKNVIYLVGQKFGTEGNPGLTWAMNTLVPAYAAQLLSRRQTCRALRPAAYPLVPVDSGGTTEATRPSRSANTQAPVLRANDSSNIRPADMARRWPSSG